MFDPRTHLPPTVVDLSWGAGQAPPPGPGGRGTQVPARLGAPSSLPGTDVAALLAIAPQWPLPGDAAALPCARTAQDPLSHGAFACLLAIADRTHRLQLMHEVSSHYTQARRADAIAMAGNITRLLGNSGVETLQLRHYWKEDGTLEYLQPMDPAVRRHPDNQARFDAATREMHRLYATLADWPGAPETATAVRSACARQFALEQLWRMPLETRQRIANNVDRSHLLRLLGVVMKADVIAFQRIVLRLTGVGLAAAPQRSERVKMDESLLPPGKRHLWERVAIVLAQAASEPLRAVPLPAAADGPAADDAPVRKASRTAVEHADTAGDDRRAPVAAGEPRVSQITRSAAIDDFILAASQFSAADLALCVRQHGLAGIVADLQLGESGTLRRVIDRYGNWRGSSVVRVARLQLASKAGRIRRPERIERLRQALQRLVDERRRQEAERIERRRAEKQKEIEKANALLAVKPDPGLETAPAQRYRPDIVADRPDGGDWLARADLSRAVLSEQSWAKFEREVLQPARMPAEHRAALHDRLHRALPAVLRRDAAQADAGFERVTTLDDGYARGQGVVTRHALPAFEPLFAYGGTVCADPQEEQAWRDRYPDAWRYAMHVGLPEPGADGGPGPDATCFGYPEGNLATNINARQLHGSERQLRKAANVGTVLVRVPGLPFGIAVLLTLQPIEAGEELFLDYGRDFSRFVAQSIRPPPLWPKVKHEPGERPAPTLEQFFRGYRGLHDGQANAPGDTAEAPRAPADWQAWLQAAGYEMRTVPPGGDAPLHALEGRLLDTVQMQQLRHDIADVIARWPDTPESDRRNAHDIA